MSARDNLTKEINRLLDKYTDENLFVSDYNLAREKAWSVYYLELEKELKEKKKENNTPWLVGSKNFFTQSSNVTINHLDEIVKRTGIDRYDVDLSGLSLEDYAVAIDHAWENIRRKFTKVQNDFEIVCSDTDSSGITSNASGKVPEPEREVQYTPEIVEEAVRGMQKHLAYGMAYGMSSKSISDAWKGLNTDHVIYGDEETSETATCTCESRVIFQQGCQCGFIEIEKREALELEQSKLETKKGG